MSIYLKVSEVKGSVTTKGYENWIKVNDVDFAGIDVAADMRVGNAVDRGSQPRFGQVSIVKSLDKSSNHFFEAAHSGDVFPSLEFHYVTSGSTPTLYAKVVLSDAMVTHYSDLHSGESDSMPRECIRFAYTKIERTFVPRNSRNQSGSPIATGFDIETAQAI